MKNFVPIFVALLATLPIKQSFAVNAAIENLLKVPNAPEVVDNLADDAREVLIGDLTNALRAHSDNLGAAKLLCAIRPWTTGDGRIDSEVRQSVWEEMVRLNPHSARYRWLDCVAVNTHDVSYRGTSLSPLFDLRQSYCTGIPLSNDMPDYLLEMQQSIKKFNSDVRAGLALAVEKEGGAARYSGYPLRNQIRLNTLGAARAVALAKNNDMSVARLEFASIADRLRSFLDEIDYVNTRNAWVYHADLQLNHGFYDWLGNGEGNLDLSQLRNWPSALNDSVIDGAIPKQTQINMQQNNDEEYVDPVFVERLLPGIAPTDDECTRWRRRSYDTRALAEQIETCANTLGHPPVNVGELRELDSCIAEYQANDWRVQFSSIDPGREKVGVQNAKRIVEKIMFTGLYQDLPTEQRNRIANNLLGTKAEPYSERYSRIVTDYGLLTEDRYVLEQIFDEMRLRTRPLMARRKIY